MAQIWLLWGYLLKNTIEKVHYGGYSMSEEKTRIHTRISPDTRRKMETAMPDANCQSQDEFVEEAIRFTATTS